MTEQPSAPYRTAALYRFSPITDPQQLATELRAFGTENGLVGSIILATEGMNGTIAGTPQAVEAMLARLRSIAGFEDLFARQHGSDRLPFGRWKIKVKPEIVTMGIDGVNPNDAVGIYVPPAEWNALISDPDTILIDTRNDYEYALGRFLGARDPATRSFRQFPQWFDAEMAKWEAEGRSPKVAMYCTGGIRCEKSTAYARQRGIDQVYHLKGGILAYLAEIEKSDSHWEGECFLFDKRISLTHGEQIGAAAICDYCGQPVAASATRCGLCDKAIVKAGEAEIAGTPGTLV